MGDPANNYSDFNNGKPQATKGKHWHIVINNYVDDDLRQFKNIEEFTTYYIVGKETGDSGTPHLQCYICGKKQITLPTLRRWFPRNLNARVCNGTPEQNRTYCSKDGDFVEYGTLPENGRKKGTSLIKPNGT